MKKVDVVVESGTSARMKLDDAALFREPLAGSLFAIDVGIAGIPEPRFCHGVTQ